jgi:putative endonuclease
LSTRENLDNRIAVGKFGEQFAREYVERVLGWRVVVQNWRCRNGEIDLVATDGTCLVIIEVRARQTDAKGSALESVDVRKVRKLQSIIPRFLYEAEMTMNLPDYQQIRFDVIALTLREGRVHALQHVRNAFDGSTSFG